MLTVSNTSGNLTMSKPCTVSFSFAFKHPRCQTIAKVLGEDVDLVLQSFYSCNNSSSPPLPSIPCCAVILPRPANNTTEKVSSFPC